MGSPRAAAWGAPGTVITLSLQVHSVPLQPQACQPLVELLNQISPTFKKNFAALQKKR